MKINQVEQLVGITKKNIRFYEDQGLITPNRNSENGYREYSTEDVDTLLKIKLLRKLLVPIEEIRKIEKNELSLKDCLERHLIYLSHEERNLQIMKEMCEELSMCPTKMSEVDASVYLEKIKDLEEGGTRFMDVTKKDTKKKKIGPIIAVACVLAYMLVMAGVAIWLLVFADMPVIFFCVIATVIGLITFGVIYVLRERLREIEGGEEYEASKY